MIDDSPVSLVNVSTAAFCKARKKLRFRAFISLNNTLIDTFYQSQQVTILPKNEVLLNHFGKARSHSVPPAVRISQLYDVKNKFTIDLHVESHNTGERNTALKHLDHAQKDDVIVYDRGYPAVWFFKYHLDKDVYFSTIPTALGQ